MLRKAGALHAHCVPGGVVQVPPVEPGDQNVAGPRGQAKPGEGVVGSVAQASPVESEGCGVAGPVGQPSPGESGPTQAAAVLASPKRARDQPDADPVQTGSEAEQEAAGGAMQEDHPLEEKDADGDKVMVEEESAVARGRQMGRARRAAPKARLDPGEREDRMEHTEEGSVASLQDLVEPGQDDAEATTRTKESKKAAKRAAKAAAKQRAKVKKQGKK